MKLNWKEKFRRPTSVNITSILLPIIAPALNCAKVADPGANVSAPFIALSAKNTADSQEASAETDYNTAVSDYNRQRSADLKKTYGQKPPVGGKAGTARGKGEKKKTN